MMLRDIMTRNVVCVRPDDTLEMAARKMRDLDVGPLPVCGENDRLAGMVTDRDITVRGVAEGKDPATTPVREVMTEEIVFSFEDQDIEDAARTMKDRQIRRLVVLNRNKRLVGIVSLGDLATGTADTERTGEVLEDISEPSTPHR